MSRVVLAITLLCLIGAAVSIDVHFTSNNLTIGGVVVTSATISDAGLGFRIATNTYLGSGVVSYSDGISISTSGAIFDTEIDASYITTAGPVTVNTRYGATAATFLTPTLTFDASSSSNYIASFPYAIVEVDSNDVDVLVHKISDFTWATTTDLTVAVANAALIGAQAFAGVKVVGTNSVTVKFYAQTSAQVGVSSYLSQDLVPKTWAFAIDISGYVLANATNSLRIVYAVATGSADTSRSASLTVPGTNTNLQVYVDLAASATSAGNTISTNVTDFATASVPVSSLFPDIQTQLTGRYSANAQVYTSNVTFAAGVSAITYAGRSGSGQRISDLRTQTADAASLHPVTSLFIAGLSLLGFVLF